MRFRSKTPFSSILPGLVFSKFDGEKTIEKLPNAEVPEKILAQVDPNFRYAPLVRIHWRNFTVLSGNQSAGLACKMPYPGWTAAFKPTIQKLMGLISDAAVIDIVERFSLKYTSIFPSEFGVAPSIVDFTLKIGPYEASGNNFQIRVELPKGDLISIVQVAAEGHVTFPDGTMKKGVPIDIDTIAMCKDLPFPKFLEELSDKLETVHTEAKSIFFSSIKTGTLEKLEPEYD